LKNFIIELINTILTSDDTDTDIPTRKLEQKEKPVVMNKKPIVFDDVLKQLYPMLKIYMKGEKEEVMEKIKKLDFQDRVKEIFEEATGDEYEP
jgi:hypothetical protein